VDVELANDAQHVSKHKCVDDCELVFVPDYYAPNSLAVSKVKPCVRFRVAAGSGRGNDAPGEKDGRHFFAAGNEEARAKIFPRIARCKFFLNAATLTELAGPIILPGQFVKRLLVDHGIWSGSKARKTDPDWRRHLRPPSR
jgi:hypothetical protein